MKITDSPGAMAAIPASGAAAPKDADASSIFQPVRSTGWAVVLVTSNQSAATGLLPLAQGATSEMNSRPTVPGEPIWFGSPAATNAPFTPGTLSCEIVALFRAAALLNEANGPVGDAPKVTLAWTRPPASKRLMASPPVPSPTPPPV